MTHAFRTNTGNLHGFHHSIDPRGIGKLGLVVLAGIGIGFEIIQSPLVKDDNPSAAPAVVFQEDLTLEPNVILHLDQVTLLARPVTAQAAEPAQAVVPETRRTTAQEAVPSAPVLVPAQTTLFAPIPDIHNIDFASLPMLQGLARQLAGRVDNTLVRFADLTGDGNAEAIVPITSEGTFGNLAFVVLTEKAGMPTAILTRIAGPERRGLIPTLDRGQVAETSGIYGPNDANCCPHQIVKTYFRWDGQAMVYDRTDVINIPHDKTADWFEPS